MVVRAINGYAFVPVEIDNITGSDLGQMHTLSLYRSRGGVGAAPIEAMSANTAQQLHAEMFRMYTSDRRSERWIAGFRLDSCVMLMMPYSPYTW
jgi:hypothetical protein